MAKKLSKHFDRLNKAKTNFHSIYTARDPRAYYRVLYGLNYIIPDLARPLLRNLLKAREAQIRRPATVLDIGCSYGINAALLKYPLDLQRLASRYASPELQRLSTDKLIKLDTHYFRAWPKLTRARVVGLDTSSPAIRYAKTVGLLDEGLASDLERHDPPPVASWLADVDLIVSTGCVGYVTNTTFERLLTMRIRRSVPWIASFVLRMFPYGDFARSFARFGLATEKLEGVTFVQRRFHSESEMRAAMAALSARGIDATGKEAEGLLHAELFVSRPNRDVRAVPLSSILSVSSGASRGFGRRFRRVAAADIALFP